jgi:hypothetical protein
MNEELMKRLNEMPATLELTVGDFNTMINVFNMPQQVQTIVLAKLIDEVQAQIGPQVARARETLEAIAKNEGAANESAPTA